MRFNTAIFDLDGTLLDTLDDIADAGNHTLRALNRPTFPTDAYRTLAGQGLDFLLIHALGPDHQHLLPDARAAHADYHQQHHDKKAKPFPGIPQLLHDLADQNFKLAILSNKPHPYTLLEADQHFPGRFDLVLGHRENYPVKPDPTSALEMLTTLNTTADRVVYIGDTAADMQTGKAANFFTVGVTWGFRDREELQRTGADAIAQDAQALASHLTS